MLVATNGIKKHLFVILNSPKEPSNKVLMVPIITNRQGQGFHQDLTCVIQKGDHVFIRSDSLVDYKHTRLELSERIMVGIAQNTFIDKGLIDEGVLLKICDGLISSPHTALEFKEFYQASQNQ